MAENEVRVEYGSFQVDYRPGMGGGGQRDASIGPLVVLTASLRENLAFCRSSVHAAQGFKRKKGQKSLQ